MRTLPDIQSLSRRISGFRAALRERRGAMLILMAAMMFVFVAMSAFTVDVAWMQLIRTELRASTDSAAKAGAEALARKQNAQSAVKAAQNYAKQNHVAGKAVKLDESDVELGRSELQNDGTWKFRAGATPYTAVRVNAHYGRGLKNKPIKLFFSHLLGDPTFTPSETATASHMENEVALCVDRSHSMCFDMTGGSWSYAPNNPLADPKLSGFVKNYLAPPHPTGSRWAALNSVVNDFLYEANQAFQKPKIALVTWGSDTVDPYATPRIWKAVTLEAQLHTNYNLIENKMRGLTSKSIIGATNVSAGLDEARGHLTSQHASQGATKTIILMTDGEWNQGRLPSAAARDCLSAGIIVHTVTFLPGSDQQTMKDVAKITGGRHFHANNAAELRATFQELARSLPVVLTQ